MQHESFVQHFLWRNHTPYTFYRAVNHIANWNDFELFFHANWEDKFWICTLDTWIRVRCLNAVNSFYIRNVVYSQTHIIWATKIDCFLTHFEENSTDQIRFWVMFSIMKKLFRCVETRWITSDLICLKCGFEEWPILNLSDDSVYTFRKIHFAICFYSKLYYCKDAM